MSMAAASPKHELDPMVVNQLLLAA